MSVWNLFLKLATTKLSVWNLFVDLATTKMSVWNLFVEPGHYKNISLEPICGPGHYKDVGLEPICGPGHYKDVSLEPFVDLATTKMSVWNLFVDPGPDMQLLPDAALRNYRTTLQARLRGSGLPNASIKSKRYFLKLSWIIIENGYILYKLDIAPLNFSVRNVKLWNYFFWSEVYFVVNIVRRVEPCRPQPGQVSAWLGWTVLTQLPLRFQTLLLVKCADISEYSAGTVNVQWIYSSTLHAIWLSWNSDLFINICMK